MTLLDEIKISSDPTDVRDLARIGPYRALEHSFEVFLPEEEPILHDFRALLRSFRTTTSRGQVRRYVIRPLDEPACYVLSYEGRRIAGGPDLARLRGILAWHINRRVIEASVDRYVLLHAAAATCEGVTVILPADQESGKTTTVAGLLREGFDYVTDEAVAIDPVSHRISPFPKCLSLDPGSWPLFPECRPPGADRLPQWQVAPSALGARVELGTVCPPKVIVFPRYVAGAVTAVNPVSRAEATRELAQMSFHFPEYPARNLSVLADIASRATVARLTIGSLDDAVRAVQQLVSQAIMEEL